jgi:hypothetical protein
MAAAQCVSNEIRQRWLMASMASINLNAIMALFNISSMANQYLCQRNVNNNINGNGVMAQCLSSIMWRWRNVMSMWQYEK